MDAPNRPTPFFSWISRAITIGLCVLALVSFYHQRINLKNREEFSLFFQVSLRAASVFILMLLVWAIAHGLSTPQKRQPNSLVSWITGFFCMQVLIVAVVFVVNPHGLYPTTIYKSIPIPFRRIKTALYDKRDQVPKVVIFGSSRAFTISPLYIEKKLGYSAYNYAVGTGLSEDFLIQFRFILSGERDALPDVLFIEVSPPLDRYADATLTWPLRLLPYAQLDVALRTLNLYLKDPFDVQTISDSFFVVHYYNTYGPPSKKWEFGPDGVGLYNLDKEDSASKDIEEMGIPDCKRLKTDGIRSIEKIVQLAYENRVAIVFYVSPIEPNYYSYLQSSPGFIPCEKALDDYFTTLDRDHDHVFYINLVELKAVTALGDQGFYDAYHLTPVGNEQVVNAADSVIREAFEWASRQRSQP